MAIPNLDTALENLGSAFADIRLLITAISYVAGVVFIFRGLAMFRAFGQHITQMSQKGEVAGPLVYIIVGAILVYLPSTMDTSFQTIFGIDSSQVETTAEVIGYSGTEGGKYSKMIDVLVSYMQLVGLVAFIRGWFILARMGDPGVQPGSMAKGLTHLIGGLIAMNIIGFAQILGETLGFTL